MIGVDNDEILKIFEMPSPQSTKNSKEKNLMDAPFWNGFYDRSKETKELFSKEK